MAVPHLSYIWLYIVFAISGFFFQSLLRGGFRLIIYPVSFILGLISAYQSNYYTLCLNIGMIVRATVGGYWYCVVLEGACLAIGLLIGLYLM